MIGFELDITQESYVLLFNKQNLPESEEFQEFRALQALGTGISNI
jgi:hypothetical protein